MFYLMLVGQTFASNVDCWHGLSRPEAKSAHRDPYGDIYEPLPGTSNAPWSERSFMAHLPGHCHGPLDRKKDIEKSYYRAKQRPRLLIGTHPFQAVIRGVGR
ncbi:MAG: hypothetical protein HY288_11010 [Planctomycetia bacterium]|nr:hypothetical protein [Planctomycetia bacterium]